MKRKPIVVILTLAFAAICVLGASACDDKKESAYVWGEVYTVQAAYAAAADLGYEGTLDDFIATISGKDGKDGVNGKDGKDGKDGVNGKDGRGIANVAINGDGELVVTFTDDSSVNLGKLSVCAHSYGDWAAGVSANCTSMGYETRDCSKCGYTEYRFIKKTGHKWDEGTKIPEAGLTVFTCDTCKETYVKITPTTENPDIPTPAVNFIAPVKNSNVIFDYGVFYEDRLLGTYKKHTGIDFAGDAGDSVYASADGEIVEIDRLLTGQTYIKILHSNGLCSKYCYLEVNEELSVGDNVKQGDVIGLIAVSGGAENGLADHLHFEILQENNYQNPHDYLNF